MESFALLIENWYPTALVDFDGGFTANNPIFIKEDGQPEFRKTNPQKLAIFQDQVFLAKKNPNVFRIVFLGESSINNIHHFLPEFSKQLKSKFPNFNEVEILNLGGKSYGSTRLLLAAKEMIQYQPDLLLVYIGHNEFEEVEQFNLINPKNAFVGNFYYHSALLRLASTGFLHHTLTQLEKSKQAEFLSKDPDTQRAWSYHFNLDDLQERMTIFKNNLEKLVSIYQVHKIPIIIGSVPSNIFNPYLPKEMRADYREFNEFFDKGDYMKAYNFGEDFLAKTVGRHQSSKIENQIIRKIASSKKIILADVEEEIKKAEPRHIPGERLFNDHCHLNEGGNKILIESFYKAIGESRSAKDY